MATPVTPVTSNGAPVTLVDAAGAAFANIFDPALSLTDAQKQTGRNNLAEIAPYLGFADNRGMIPDSVASSGSAQQIMVRSLRYARAAMSYPRPVIPIGWYVSSTNVETVLAGTYGVRASIEYPIGTFTQLTFGGSVTGSYAGGTYAVPDAAFVPIPRGATYAVKYWIDSPNGYIYTNNYAGLAGDAANVGATTADLTMSAMAGSSPGAVGHGPIGVIDTITQRSFFFIGDSLMAGHGTDTRDTSGDFGVGARIVGAMRGYCNAGRSSTTAAQFLSGSNSTIRVAIGNAYASDIVCNFGVNDCLNSVAATTTATNLRSIRALFPTKRFYQHTITPVTNGAGSAWAANDASDQVVNATASSIIETLNGLIRLGLVTSNSIPITGILDTKAAAQYKLSVQKFDPGLTTEGIHLGGDSGYRIVAARTPGSEQLQW